ncbi:hypothetical protein E8E14_010861 [Neopestalotiopsis sp. 37M]|nr:hypothetical protein E8E14_010861 [Neopestalotiopsis sp. 37M]
MDWWWWWEIGASALSIACVAAIVGVLVYINNLAIDQWNFQISPNSLIAVMTTISKAAMMVPIAACISQLKWVYFSGETRPIRNLDLFDAASRGPWGSLCFIPSIRTEAITASALALVTILALGVEPTAQQILGLSSRLQGGQDHGNSVYIPLASSYSSKMADFEGDFDSTWGNPASSDLIYQQAAIARGVAGDIPSLDFHCPDEAVECRWAKFDTLGVCTTVRNVTVDIKPNCSSDDQGPLASEATCVFDFGTIRNSSRLGPTILVPRPFIETEVKLSPIEMIWSFTDDNIPGALNYYVSVGSTGVDNAGSNLDLVRYPVDPQLEGPEQHPQRSWKHGVSSGTDVVATASGIKSFNRSIEDLYRSSDEDRQGLYVGNNTGTEYFFDPEVIMTSAKFQASEKVLLRYISHAFTDQLYGGTYLEQENDNDRVLSFGRFIYGADIPHFAHNVADTLSVLIRQNNSGDNLKSSYQYGTAFSMTTYYNVRWGWLVLPLVETILTAILLILAIIQSRKQPLLKSSQLALVSYGAGTQGQDKLVPVKPPRTTTALESELGKRKVRLSRNETGHIAFMGR